MMYFAEFTNINYVFAVWIHLKFDAKWVLAVLGSYHLQNEFCQSTFEILATVMVCIVGKYPKYRKYFQRSQTN